MSMLIAEESRFTAAWLEFTSTAKEIGLVCRCPVTVHIFTVVVSGFSCWSLKMCLHRVTVD